MDDHPVLYCINLGRRMNQYDLWPGFEGFTGQNALFVRTNKGIPDEVREAFKTCESETVDTTTRQKKVMQFTFVKCYDFKGIKAKPMESF
jgi:hypothetical protein